VAEASWKKRAGANEWLARVKGVRQLQNRTASSSSTIDHRFRPVWLLRLKHLSTLGKLLLQL
jgi:hypothetical protein